MSNETLKSYAKRIPFLRTAYRTMVGKRSVQTAAPVDLRATGPLGLRSYYESSGEPAIVTVPLSKCRWFGPTGFSYGEGSSHPYIMSLEQYKKDGPLRPQETFLYQYYENFRPNNLAEFLRLSDTACNEALIKLPPLKTVLPWLNLDIQTVINKHAGHVAGSESLTRRCGPHSIDYVERRLETLVFLFDKISHEGFWEALPTGNSYSDSFRVGVVLVRDGKSVVMLADGNHRASVLSVLGYESMSILVGYQAGGPAIVRYEDAALWPLVRMGLFSEAQATAVFDMIFEGKTPAY